MAETGAEHVLHRLVVIGTACRQRLAQFIGLLAATAPEGEFTHLVEQRRDEDFLFVSSQYIAGDVARLHCRMERARQQLLQLLTRRSIEQPVDQTDRQADQAHIIEADHDDGAGNGLDGFLRWVVIAAVADPKHLGGQRGVAQQNIGQLLNGRMFLFRKTLQVLYDGCQRWQLGLVQAVNPRLQAVATITQILRPQTMVKRRNGKAVCLR